MSSGYSFDSARLPLWEFYADGKKNGLDHSFMTYLDYRVVKHTQQELEARIKNKEEVMIVLADEIKYEFGGAIPENIQERIAGIAALAVSCVLAEIELKNIRPDRVFSPTPDADRAIRNALAAPMTSFILDNTDDY